MTEGNSGIADLSDPNRPQKLCEQFNNLYDNLWTDAFDHLSRTVHSERIVCEDLVTIFKVRLALRIHTYYLMNAFDFSEHNMSYHNCISQEHLLSLRFCLNPCSY